MSDAITYIYTFIKQPIKSHSSQIFRVKKSVPKRRLQVMSTLEKTINLLNTMPEYQLENIYSYARFLRSQSKGQKEMPDESIDYILDSLVGAVSDDGKTLEEYREERRKERYF